MGQGSQVFKATGTIWEKDQSWVDNKTKRTLRYHGWQSSDYKASTGESQEHSFIWDVGLGVKLWGRNIGVWLRYMVLGLPRPHPAFFGSPSVSLPWFPLQRIAILSFLQSSNSCVSMDLMGWTSIGSTLALVEALLRTSISSLSWCRWGGRWQCLAQENSKPVLFKENLVVPEWN